MDLERVEKIIKIQQNASDIKRSVWVSASAGSGKTSVLTKRLIRLLLNGVKPSKILCITFTKNAASEMKNRIYEKLAEWALLSEDKLRQDIHELTGLKPTEQTLLSARILFATILDNADELKILTIHSFCQQVMKKFPFEAGIVPNFEIANERLEEEFLIDAKKELLTKNTLKPELDSAIKKIAIQVNEEGFVKLLSDLLRKRDKLVYLRDVYGNTENIIKEIYKKLGVNINDAHEDIFRNFVKKNISTEELNKCYDIIQELGTEKEKSKFSILKIWINKPQKRENIFEDYKNLFLTKSDNPRKNIVTKKIKDAFPELENFLRKQQQKMQNFMDKLKSVKIAELTKSLLIIGYEILSEYDSIKKQKGFLDYNDLIIKTKNLLTNAEYSHWISYKLDAGIDHILLDEAQDTSLYQWKIIDTIVQEFSAGMGQKETDDRTLFVVGDEKQSIFSFQGAKPDMLKVMNQYYEKIFNESKNEFRTISLNCSFRSLSSILKLVDKIFEKDEMKISISKLESKIEHFTVRKGVGKVELWPLVKQKQKEKKNNFKWELLFEKDIETKNIETLSGIIADKIKEWIRNGRIIKDRKTGKERLLKYSDIMILLKSRTNNLADYLIKKFHVKKIPVSGIDRLKLTRNIVIKDLIALANFILFPEDDLNLANIIKSPILGLSEEDLFALCRYKEEVKTSVWEAIQKNEKYTDTKNYLEGIIEKNKFLTPYELFFDILENQNGRKLITQRFTETINVLLDEFLNLLKEYEKDHIPSLSGFIKYFKMSPVEIKRDMERTRNEVRIMTVHASKGLQAPVVILPDTYHSTRNVPRTPNIFWTKDSNSQNDINYVSLPFWNGGSENDNQFISNLKESSKKDIHDEYMRLLYVAMTRAANELYICGWEIANPYAKNWYNLAEKSIKELGRKKVFNSKLSGTKEFYYILGEEDKFSKIQEKGEKKTEEESKKILEKLNKPIPKNQSAKIINPSKFYAHGNKTSPIKISDSLLKGKAIHKLLEILPSVKVAERDDVLDYYAYNLLPNFSEKNKRQIKNNVLNILEKFPDLFSENSQAEVSVVGRVGEHIVSGQIDRLVIRERKIIIVDYKNTSRSFRSSKEIPQSYKEQLKLYKSLIQKIYPNKNIECYILLTSHCSLLRIFE